MTEEVKPTWQIAFPEGFKGAENRELPHVTHAAGPRTVCGWVGSMTLMEPANALFP